jgi:iron complex outermembrane receptor protein
VNGSVAVFRSNIRDQQISTFDGRFTTVVINNAGKTRANGVDLALAARPTPALTLTANATFQHARFVDFQNGAVNYDGKNQLRSPDLTAYLAADYSLSLGEFGSLRLHGDYSRTSKLFFDNANTELPGLYQPAYGIGNARLTLAPNNMPSEFSVFVRNIGNTLYYQNIAIVGATGTGVANDPRTYGAFTSEV